MLVHCHLLFYKHFYIIINYLWDGSLNTRVISSKSTCYFKSPELRLGHKNWKKLNCPANLNNCMIKHDLKIKCASFPETFTQIRTFYNSPFNLRGNHVLVKWAENRCTFHSKRIPHFPQNSEETFARRKFTSISKVRVPQSF